MNQNTQHKYEYSRRFDATDKQHLKGEKVPAEVANGYPSRCNGLAIAAMYSVGCTADKCKEYFSKLYNIDGMDVYSLYKGGCSAEDAMQFDFRSVWDACLAIGKTADCPVFLSTDVVSLHSTGCSLEKSLEYYYAFREKGITAQYLGGAIADFFSVNCPAEIASDYPEEVLHYGFMMYNMGIMPDTIPKTDMIRLSNVLRMGIQNEEVYNDPKNYTLLGTGNMSVVFLDRKNNIAIKTSEDIREELSILRDIGKIKSPHIARLKGAPSERYIIELEYINGDSLENILKKEHKLDYDRVFKYGADIMSGLIEMRHAGIFYHMDIRPANIMIDEINDRAVIIDLGIATRDRHAPPLDNRRYGGPNDLVSLGQVMYKMATGEHIFAESRSMEMTRNASQIKDQREQIYADATGKSLEKYLKKVDENIKDERIKTIIKTCLTARNSDHKRVWKMFEKPGTDNEIIQKTVRENSTTRKRA